IFPNKTTQDHVPIYYGVSETLYAPVVKGGKVYRSPSPPFGWINILANQVQGQEASWPFNMPGERYIFTMAYDRDFRLTVPQTDTKLAAEVAAVRARIGINTPVYLTSQLVVVLITRDGRLPVRQMTIGESLAAAEAGIRRQMVREPGPQAMYAEQLAGVARMRAQHALDLNAPASSRNSQFFHYLFDSDQDVFARNTDGSSYPIYTFEPWAYEGAKSDTPQWLLISFPRSAASNSWGEQMAYEDMVNHFNYAYARDAIFNPQAVAGVAYAPRP
ncbi:MAG: hypothetical protein J0I28_07700, partial [Caulobacterales bacterium]|nr:hypothetical protein [Caulobacterales bacterium]